MIESPYSRHVGIACVQHYRVYVIGKDVFFISCRYDERRNVLLGPSYNTLQPPDILLYSSTSLFHVERRVIRTVPAWTFSVR
jgi:hypothetical protein